MSQSQSPSLPEEFGITPVRGYRMWSVLNTVRLASLNFDLVWEPGKVTEAQCFNNCSSPPSVGRCGNYGKGCGIYAVHRSERIGPMSAYSLAPPRMTAVSTWVWGVVEGWGRVVWHKDGWRAQYARPVAISATSRLAETVSKTYSIPCLRNGVLLREFPPQVPWSL